MFSVSVVIPAYNGASFLRQALQAVFAQTLPPREVIVVDDASTDDSPAVVQAVAQGGPMPVRLIRLEKNSGGPAGPMNVGVARAEGQVIVILDQDDLMMPERIASLAGFLERFPECPLAFGLYRLLGTDGALTEKVTATEVLGAAHRQVGDGEYLIDARSCYHRLLTFRNFAGGASNTAFRKSAWERLGGFCDRYRIIWDLDFACRCCTLGDLGFVSRVVQHHRVHTGNLSGQLLLWAREFSGAQERHLQKPLLDVDLCEVRPMLGDLYLHLGHGEAHAGNWARALRAYGRSIRFGGRKFKAVAGMAKVLPLRLQHLFRKFASAAARSAT